jgi:hypothetical protein
MEHNPLLTPAPADKGGETSIEHPAKVENVAWQTRAAPPTARENALADALQSLFAEEIHDLPTLAWRLQGLVPPPEGAATWTEAALAAELHRLGR